MERTLLIQIKIAIALIVIGLVVLGWIAWLELKPIGPSKQHTEKHNDSKEVYYP